MLTGNMPYRYRRAGEDTAFQPLVPDLIAALNSADRAAAIAAVGKRYVAAMRARVPANSPNPNPARIVDKMLRNAWNVGHIAIALPRAQVVRNRARGMSVDTWCSWQNVRMTGTRHKFSCWQLAEQCVPYMASVFWPCLCMHKRPHGMFV